MTRWILLALTILGFVVMFIAKSPGLLALGLLLVVVGVLGFAWVLAADRVAANSRPESSMASGEELAALRRRRATTTPAATAGGPGTSVDPAAIDPARRPR